MGFSTDAIHAGQIPDPTTGSSNYSALFNFNLCSARAGKKVPAMSTEEHII